MITTLHSWLPTKRINGKASSKMTNLSLMMPCLKTSDDNVCGRNKVISPLSSDVLLMDVSLNHGASSPNTVCYTRPTCNNICKLRGLELWLKGYEIWQWAKFEKWKMVSCWERVCRLKLCSSADHWEIYAFEKGSWLCLLI